MEIKVKRTKEFKKGGFLSSPHLEFGLEVSISLSEEDKALVQKYGDLTLEGLRLRICIFIRSISFLPTLSINPEPLRIKPVI